MVSTGPDAFFARIGKNVSSNSERRCAGEKKNRTQRSLSLPLKKKKKNVQAVVNVGVLPASATVLKKLAMEFDIAGLAKMAGVPDVLLAPALGVLAKAVRGIVPV